MTIVKLLAILWMSIPLVSCFLDKNLYGKPMKSLQVYLSFEEPQIVIYGHEKELATFKNVFNEPQEMFMAISDTSKLTFSISFSRSEYMVEHYGMNPYDMLSYQEVDWVADQASSIEFRWQEELRISRYDEEHLEMNSLKEMIFLFASEDFEQEPSILEWEFSKVRAGTTVAKYYFWGDRPMSYSLTFKEVERDEQGILFELFLINNREIEK